MKTDVIVIGAGLFGSMITRHFQDNGLDVICIDSQEPMAASKCSFGVWKDGWVNKTIQPEAQEGMDLLEQMTDGIHEMKIFNVGKERYDDFKRVDCSKLLLKSFHKANVNYIHHGTVEFTEASGDEGSFFARKAIIVAAGVWTPKILTLQKGIKSTIGIDSAWGATLDINYKIEESTIKEWAPYRQSLLLDIGTKVVFGDGCAVKNPSVNDPRVEMASTRLLKHFSEATNGLDYSKIKVVNEGYRPYLKKGSSGFVQKHGEKLYSATGGAKNSTILCGHVAKRLLTLIKNS